MLLQCEETPVGRIQDVTSSSHHTTRNTRNMLLGVKACSHVWPNDQLFFLKLRPCLSLLFGDFRSVAFAFLQALLDFYGERAETKGP